MLDSGSDQKLAGICVIFRYARRLNTKWLLMLDDNREHSFGRLVISVYLYQTRLGGR
jgi:hypothetical protein